MPEAAEKPKIAIHAQGLTKTYGSGVTEVRAMSEATFEVPAGEFVVILGASGSGKTTLLNMIGALESPTSGDIEVFGNKLAGLDEDGRTKYRLDTVGFIFQFYNLVPTLTARENVQLLAELTGPDPGKRTEDVLARVGLGEKLDSFPSELSGGQQQRISIARGVVKGSPLLLCDEPTGALDKETGVKILRVLYDVARDGCTVLAVTHAADIAKMADRVIHVSDGRIVSCDPNPDRLEPEDISW